MYVLTQKLLRSVQSLRDQGVYQIPCTVLIEGREHQSLIGPALTPTECYVLVEKRKVPVCIAVIGIDETVKAQLEANALERAEEETEIERAAQAARMWQRSGQRRNPTTGRYAGHHCEKAGR